MSLIPYHPFSDFDQLWNNMKLFSTDGNSGLLSPKIEVAEKDDQYQISAEFPGVKKEDIDITLENGVLTLSAQTHSDEKKEEKGKVIYQERKYGKFARSFTVGQTIEQDDIKANFQDGVLTLIVPKKSEALAQSTKIPIHS